jgi:hypothetical protein
MIPKKRISIPVAGFRLFLIFLLFFELLVTVLYGVGFMGRQRFPVPPGGLRFLIQVLNRFNYVMGVFIFIIVNDKSGNKFNIFLLILVILISILRASLGILVFIVFFSFLLYKKRILRYFRKYFFLLLIILLLLPQIVYRLYGLRDILRNTSTLTSMITPTDIIFGRLIGRLSSFSNSAYILENKRDMTTIISRFSLFQYPKETLDAFYNVEKKDKQSYRHIMLDSIGRYYSIVGFSLMTSTQGVLLLSSFYSPLVFLINLVTVILIVNITFLLVSKLQNDKIMDMLFLYLCFPVLSGTASGYLSVFVYLLMYVILFLIFNFLGLNKKLNSHNKISGHTEV